MKARSEIIELCIVNIQIAAEIGKIRDVVLDPVSKGIAYYVLAEPSDYFGARLINQKHAVGLGGFALTVTGEQIIEDVAHCPQAVELLKGGIQVIGTHALSDKGVLLGMVRQIFFDETTGSIVRYRIENEEGRVFDIDGVDVVTLGSNFTIFLDDSILIDTEEAEAVSYGSDPYASDFAYEDGAQVSSADRMDEQASQDPYDELPDALEGNEHGGSVSAEASDQVLRVSARPLSAAEMALVKAAESLRQKYAAEALRAQAADMAEKCSSDMAENYSPAAPARSSYYSANQAPAQAAANRPDRPGRTNGAARFEKTDRLNKMDETNRGFETDRKIPSERIENKGKTDEYKKTEQASAPKLGSADAAKSAEPVSNRGAAQNRNAEHSADAADGRNAAENKNTAAVYDLSQGQNKGSLSASELIYPKDFNLFDRRQMQFLLGKRLVQAVQLESGEIMEEGEYITAEMLSRVRSRNTLMELTAHVRKA